MSLDKLDIRCKLDPRDHAFLSGEAQARGIDICDVFREVIGQWVDYRREAHRITQRLLAVQGHDGDEPVRRPPRNPRMPSSSMEDAE